MPTMLAPSSYTDACYLYDDYTLNEETKNCGLHALYEQIRLSVVLLPVMDFCVIMVIFNVISLLTIYTNHFNIQYPMELNKVTGYLTPLVVWLLTCRKVVPVRILTKVG